MNRKMGLRLPFILLGFTILACTISFNLGGASNSFIVDVAAEEGWVDTRITISEGDLLTVTYLSGKWSPWPGGAYDAIGSGGDPRCRCNIMDGVSHAALIGRIGTNDPFLVGAQYHHKVGEKGVLFLGINDVDLYDNSDFLHIRVEVD